jgi:ABC-2 type transport system permease protein
MRAYFSAFRIRLIRGLQYRTAAAAGAATQFFWGFMLITVLQSFVRSSTNASPMGLSQIASYIWLQQAFLAFVVLWMRDNELLALMVSGDVAYEFCRPVDVYSYWYARLVAQRVAAAALRCLPILLVAFLLPDPYRLHLPRDTAGASLFLITLILGLPVMISISMFLYILTFKTKSPLSVFLALGQVGDFLAGMIIPLPMMPEALQRILYFLPFRLFCDLPFRAYSGSIDREGALLGIMLQVFWLAVLIGGGRAAFRRVSRRADVPGG